MNITDMTLIGSGAQADIYLYDEKAIKIFNENYIQANAHYEAELQDKAHKKGLPVPSIYEITEICGRTAIVMEYIKGTTIGELILRDIEKVHDYLDLTVDLQIKVHQTCADGFPSQMDKLKNNIMNTSHLDNGQREKLLSLLFNLKTDNKLCHGDFHVLNLIQTSQSVKIIDWVDASSGSISADVCRSYLLYLIYRKEVADIYLDIYCSKSNIHKKDILIWLPIIAGARLNDNVTSDDINMLIKLVNEG